MRVKEGRNSLLKLLKWQVIWIPLVKRIFKIIFGKLGTEIASKVEKDDCHYPKRIMFYAEHSIFIYKYATKKF